MQPIERLRSVFVRTQVLLVAALWVSVGCGAPDSVEPPSASAAPEPAAKSQPAGVEKRSDAWRLAAWAWLDDLEVDPVALTTRGVKGKKKLGEALSAYLYLLRYSKDPNERPRIWERIRALAAQTDRPEYHNMLRCDRREFNQSRMSYLRVAWLLEQLGLDSYRTQLDAMRPRLERSLAVQPPSKAVRFTWYYEFFGWPLPEALEASNTVPGIIANRTPLSNFERMTGYALGHEVMVAFRFGLRRNADVFDTEDRAYLRKTLPALVIRSTSKRKPNLDQLPGLLSAMTYLGFEDRPAYPVGLRFLLAKQNPDGSWGDYESHRSTMGNDVDPKLYLHTTMVALRALLESDDGAWKKSFVSAADLPIEPELDRDSQP